VDKSGNLATWKLLRPDAKAVTKDKMAWKSLRRYFSVISDEKPAKFTIAKKLPAKFHTNDNLKTLWQNHNNLTRQFCELEKAIDCEKVNLEELPTPTNSYLDLKIEIANQILQSCHLCTRRCSANRREAKLGYCKCGREMKVSSIFEHLGEEPELVPSGTVFTMGCTIRCKHCQNWTISQWEEDGVSYEPKELATWLEQLRLNGCRNINLVGGEPTPWLPQWLSVFRYVNVNVPIVWNSNAYYSTETAQLLAGFADIYLLDFKYGPQSCAEKISDAEHYWQVCTRNHLKAKKFGEIIVRILVLPGHLECCTKATIDWIAKHLGTSTRINIMFQYRPEWRAFEIPELRQKLTNNEKDMAVRMAREAGLKNFIT
jgi:putative pyruvate formate lyase activating enzyme